MDTAIFQRLRRLRQLALASLVCIPVRLIAVLSIPSERSISRVRLRMLLMSNHRRRVC